jgi:hypothetical protein
MVDKYTEKFNRAKVSLRAMDDFVLDAAFAHTPIWVRESPLKLHEIKVLENGP